MLLRLRLVRLHNLFIEFLHGRNLALAIFFLRNPPTALDVPVALLVRIV